MHPDLTPQQYNDKVKASPPVPVQPFSVKVVRPYSSAVGTYNQNLRNAAINALAQT
mgnify:CR=1 FL=1|jgi:hypothetical protein